MKGLTLDRLVGAYAHGIFPMAREREDSRLYWVDPEQRGILPLDSFHLPRRLARTLRQTSIEIRCDTAFEAVIQTCGAAAPDRPESWINAEIITLFGALHRLGLAHSVESWHEGELVGGLYGLALGGAFFGESMFSRATDASKLALVHLVARLRRGGFTLLDTQFITEHLRQFGAIEIPRAAYHHRLAAALAHSAHFDSASDWTAEAVLAALR